MESLTTAAIGLAASGIPVFPLRSNKRPCHTGGFKTASIDPETVRRAFADPLAALIGVPTGAVSGFDVLDIDPRDGGAEWLRANEHRIPATRRHHTRSSGVHLLFKHQPGMRNSASRIAPGVDVRGDGGYVVWWPAEGLHELGDAHAEWPAWLSLEIMRGQSRERKEALKPEDLAPPSAALLLDLLAAMPNPAETTRDEYTAVNLAVQGCIRGLEGLGLLDDPTPIYDAAATWSASWDDGDASDFETERARWDADWSQRERDLSGWRHLLELATKLGVDMARFHHATAAADFGALPPEENPYVAPAPAEPGLLNLDHDAPMASARELVARQFTDGGSQTVHRHAGMFHRWTGSHYLEMPDAEIKADTYRFLERAFVVKKGVPEAFNPTRHRVADVMEALAAVTQLPSAVSAPAWLGGSADRPVANEIISCANGLLHVPTRQLIPHTPAFFNSHAIGYAYDATAPAPAEWLKFLASVWPDDQESIATLQEVIGLLLTAQTCYQKIFMLIGPKRSGKGTIARVLTALLGQENVCNPSLASLATNFGAAPLIGKPLATITDARLNGRSDIGAITERLLNISGDDGQTIDRKYREEWNGRLPTRFLMLTNELPRLTDASGALASRFIILQMQQSFYGREDMGLEKRLLRELPGIMNWALDGLDRLTTRGHFVQPATAREAINELEDLASPVGAFLKATCVVGPAHSVSRDNLFDAWRIWCQEEGRDAVGTKATFGRDLRASVPNLSVAQRTMPDGERVRVYEGVGLPLPNRFGTAHEFATRQGEIDALLR